jgi:hypothetical protein
MKLPPIHQTVHCELGSVVGYANRDVTSVPGQIVNSKGNRHTLRVAREVGIYRYWLPAPSLSLTSVVPNEFLLFCIDADYWKALSEKLRLCRGDVSELLVAVGMFSSGLLLFIDLERVTHFAQQARDCVSAGLMSFFLEGLAEAPKTAAYPFLIAHWVASNFI